MAAATGAIVAALTGPARTAVGWCGAVATVLVTVVAAVAVHRERALRTECAERTALLERRIAAQNDDLDHLRTEILPRAVAKLREAISPAQVLSQIIDQTPELRGIPDAQRRLLRAVLQVIDREIARRDSALRAFVHIARRVQAIVHQQADALREMEEDHGLTPEVAGHRRHRHRSAADAPSGPRTRL